MYLLFTPAFLALVVIGFITLRDQFGHENKDNGYVEDFREPAAIHFDHDLAFESTQQYCDEMLFGEIL
jgi:hypothetical protein